MLSRPIIFLESCRIRMITITQNKVAGFGDTRWAPYPGFSVLFDNPSGFVRDGEHIIRVDRSTDSSAGLDLYSQLNSSLPSAMRDLLLRTYLLFFLPASSYHVTVWDGVNVGNVSR